MSAKDALQSARTFVELESDILGTAVSEEHIVGTHLPPLAGSSSAFDAATLSRSPGRMITYSLMYKPSRASISGLVGLTAFGVAYDFGLFGTPDGHDHSATISIASSTGISNGTVVLTPVVLNNVTGEDVTVVPSEMWIKAQNLNLETGTLLIGSCEPTGRSTA